MATVLDDAIESWYVRLVSPFYDDVGALRRRCVYRYLAREAVRERAERPLYDLAEEGAIMDEVSASIERVAEEGLADDE